MYVSLSCLFIQQLHTELAPTSLVSSDPRLSPDSCVDFIWPTHCKLHLLLCCCRQAEAFSCSAFSMLYSTAHDLPIYSANMCGAPIA